MSDAPKPKMIPPWTKMACANCGAEELATRGDPMPAEPAFVCEACEMYERGALEALPPTWTGGPLPDDGLVLVDAAALRKLVVDGMRNAMLVPALESRVAELHEAEVSLRKRWADLGTIHRDERARRQELEHELDRMRAAAMGDEDTPTVLTMSGETGQDGADECECGGKMWCLTCQQSAWPSRADDCLAPTPEAS